MQELCDYREKIDKIDSDIITLFENRMNLVRKVAEYKKIHKMPVLQATREQEVLTKAQNTLHNPAYAPQACQLMQTLMELSRAAQHHDLLTTNSDNKITVPDFSGTVGYPGVKGSFSEQAMLEFFKREGIAYPDFEDVFEALKSGEIQYAIVPIENSSTGSVTKIYDLLNTYGFFIVGEHFMKISQNLVGLPGTSLENIRTVYSHAQGIEQSSHFLAKHRNWETIHFINTSISAKLVADSGDFTKAAIAGKHAAELYNLEILAPNIQNSLTNTTRFIVIAKQFLQMNTDKISLSFTLDNESGTLYNVLRHFSQGHINMVKIESRPIPGILWNYRFYLDFEGSPQSPEVTALLESLSRETKSFRLLGAYQRSV